MRLLLASFFLLLLAAFSATSLHATDCQFVLGFETLRELIGHDVVGECLENEHYEANGDGLQQTTGGLLVWRKADNWTAFTDGYRTWINGPNGLQQRLNTERFEWEYDYAPGGGIATPTPTPMVLNPEHILVPVLEVMRSTPSGEGAYQELFQLGVGITFGGNPPWGKYIFHVPSNRIVLYGNYVHEPPDTIAPLVAEATELAKWFHVHGEPTTPEECIERKYLVLTSREIWLTEFNGHSPVSDVERRLRAQQYVYHRIHRDSEFCPAVPRASARDADIERALETLRQTATGRRVHDWFVESGVSAYFDQIDYQGGVYSPKHYYIAINEAHRNSPVNAAAWFVHETIHAMTHDVPESQEECYGQEERAFSWQAQWWMEYFGNGGSGLQDEDSKSQDSILRDYLNGTLLNAIRGTRAYQDYCGSYHAGDIPLQVH